MNAEQTNESISSEPFQVLTDASRRVTIDDLNTSLLGTSNTILNDPVLLRVAIRRCRLDCAEAERRITKLKEDNQDYVPKEDFLALRQNHNDLLKVSEQLKVNFRNAKVEYNALVEALEHLIKDRDKYFHLCETYRATLTPRPKWEQCASVIDRWNELSIGKTSNERVDILLNEIIGGNDIYNNVVQFIGLGLDPTVPTFLQTTANIPNRHFMQRDVCLLIEDIWKQKLQYDAEQAEATLLKKTSSSRASLHSQLLKNSLKPSRKISLVDYMHVYFKQRGQLPALQVLAGDQSVLENPLRRGGRRRLPSAANAIGRGLTETKIRINEEQIDTRFSKSKEEQQIRQCISGLRPLSIAEASVRLAVIPFC